MTPMASAPAPGHPAGAASPRPPPGGPGGGPLDWARRNLFGSWASTAITLVMAYLLLRGLWGFFSWAVLEAVWTVPANANGQPDTRTCRELKGTGACWALIVEKHRFIFFGTYPYEEHWRPLLCIFLFVALYAASCMRRFWNRNLALVWIVGLSVIAWLMWGGFLGLPYVENERWGGLVITLVLATFGIAFAFPVAIALALGRRSRLPAISTFCVTYIELIRGVPLISVLFMASVMFPLFLPEGMTFDKLLRAQAGIVLFTAAYLAEVIRGGLQALPRGQYEAADALGLSWRLKTLLVVLPQALRLVIPPMVNSFIGLFKDTSLVVIIGIFDLLNAAKTAIVEPAWQGFGVEAYVFVSIIYFVFCFAMSRYSEGLESELNQHRRR
ncbi:MAG: amino acid ABC transporter permease [Alphaproteobacteria bacterium]